jgi:hypothetical protein
MQRYSTEYVLAAACVVADASAVYPLVPLGEVRVAATRKP